MTRSTSPFSARIGFSLPSRKCVRWIENAFRLGACGLILAAMTRPLRAGEFDNQLADRLKLAVGGRAAGAVPQAKTKPDPVADPRAITLGTALQKFLAVQGLPVAPALPPRPLAALAAGPAGAPVAPPAGEIYLRENRTVRQVRAASLAPPAPAGLLLQAAGDRFERAARRFFAANPPLLQLDAPNAELAFERRENLEGGALLRFSQQYRGLRVWPGRLTAQFDANERLVCIDGAYVPTPRLPQLDPKLTAEEASRHALARLPREWHARTDPPELIVFALLGAAPRLAWKLDVLAGLDKAWRIVLDAADGRLLHQEPLVLDAGVPGSGVDLFGTSRALQVWQQGNTYVLLDTSKPMFAAGSDPLQNPRGVIKIGDAGGTPIAQLNEFSFITSASPTSWTIPAAVSAAFNFSQTYDYFRERHNRNSLDDAGGNITAVVRVGNYDNASWHGNLSLMLFGEVKPFAGSLDVVGHELSHGVTEKTANLVYALQPGALNEAFSDIFGEMVEARARGQNDWLMGSELNGAFRNMKNPGALTIAGLNRPYPSKMSEFIELPNSDDADHGGVHLNSSIINHCFYLLAEGLPEAIGRSDAERIFYRTLAAHLQPQSQFIDCRLGAVASAEALFGADSPQARATARAFDAVEIFAAPSTPDPTPVPVVQGPDSSLFVYETFFGLNLGRRETALSDPAEGTVFAIGVKKSRPAVTGDGASVLYVSENFDLCAASTANPADSGCLGFSGFVHSVAVSPDGALAAFVLRDPATGEPEGRISIVHLATSNTRTFTLVAPVVDGVAVDQVAYADAMSFSTDSTKLIYDAVSRVRFANGPALERWSLYALDLATERTEIVVPPLDGIDTGNPSPGRAGNRYLAFDARVNATGESGIVLLDLFSGQLNVVANSGAILGFPSLAGDESAVTFAAPNGNIFGSGVSLFQQRLAADRLGTIGVPQVWQSEAVLGVVYRRGTFSGTNALPSVSLTATIATVGPPATVQLQATVADTDGRVAWVEFFQGAQKIGETLDPAAGTASFTWTGVAPGDYRFTARATDNLGGASDSAPILLAVGGGNGGPKPAIAAARLADGTLRLTVSGPPARYVIEQSVNLAAWTDYQTITVVEASTSIADPRVPNSAGHLFYRVRRLP